MSRPSECNVHKYNLSSRLMVFVVWWDCEGRGERERDTMGAETGGGDGSESGPQTDEENKKN